MCNGRDDERQQQQTVVEPKRDEDGEEEDNDDDMRRDCNQKSERKKMRRRRQGREEQLRINLQPKSEKRRGKDVIRSDTEDEETISITPLQFLDGVCVCVCV